MIIIIADITIMMIIKNNKNDKNNSNGKSNNDDIDNTKIIKGRKS